MWTREAIGAHVDELAGRASFVADVERFAHGLDEQQRALLAAVLLERAGASALREAFDERRAARGWFGRLWERTERRAGTRGTEERETRRSS